MAYVTYQKDLFLHLTTYCCLLTSHRNCNSW